MIGGKWEGWDEAKAALERIASEVTRDEVLEAALLDVTRPIAAEMGEALYTKVTRVTGETGESIEAARNKDEEVGTVAVKIGPRTKGSRASLASSGFKVKFWEFGTSRLAARPFMRPTWDAHEGSITQRFVAAIRPAYDRALAKFSRRSAA